MDIIPVDKSLDLLDRRCRHMASASDESRDLDRTHL